MRVPDDPYSIAAYLANEGRKVTVVFETTDAILAVPTPLPDFIRKSRRDKVIEFSDFLQLNETQVFGTSVSPY
jgi:hypothetical protein